MQAFLGASTRFLLLKLDQAYEVRLRTRLPGLESHQPSSAASRACRTHLRAEGPKSVGCVMNEGCETPSTVERGFENRCESAELPEKCRGPIVCVLLVRGSSGRARFCALVG